jgi:hypothetical protein
MKLVWLLLGPADWNTCIGLSWRGAGMTWAGNLAGSGRGWYWRHIGCQLGLGSHRALPWCRAVVGSIWVLDW